ncbi:MAG: DUF58 domain-containing protein [Candidatus Dormibacteraeota bacterium]|nr:DUF58 domain-containing protein [Candidatus Dormibacteraeota bacterium]
MTRLLTPKLGAYAALTAAGLLAALLFARAEAAVLALPFALVALLGMASVREPQLEMDARLDRERVLEGERAVLSVRLRAATPVRRIELSVHLPFGLALAETSSQPELTLRAGEERIVELGIDAHRWGAYDVGSMLVRTRDRFGLLLFEHAFVRNLALRAYPTPDRLRTMLAPIATQAHAGNTVSRERGDGIEFADVREFMPGDRVRHVNWRVSARRSGLHVNQHHLERNADVVIFIDTFAEVGGGKGTTLDLAIRGAASLAGRYLTARDRVGMIGFGGIIRWLRPGLGTVQLYRLIDSLLDTRVVASYAWKGIDVIPAGTLPPRALLLALTPLVDERSIGALLDVRGRGFDVAVIELDPVPFVAVRTDENGELAHRLWLLQREALRKRFRAAGIPIATWNEQRPLEAALEEVRASRRHVARVRA